MRLIEAEKVVQAIKDYWKAQVDRMPTPYSTEEFEKFANHVAMCLEYRDDLLKAIDELPSVQPDTTIYDSNEVKKGENDEDRTSGDCISRQQAIEAVVGCTNCGTEDVLRAYVTKHSLENGWTGGIVDALDAIELLPSVQPERPKGEWIHQAKFSRVECDKCGKVFRNTFAPKNFCPNCGADMRGEAE